MDDSPRVLLVDDEKNVLSALRRTLRREPFELEVARDGTEALARLQREPYVSLVISDYKMPGMNGIELLTESRALSESTARILLSGWTSEIPEAQKAAAGLFANLPKPWDDVELKNVIRKALAIDR